MYEWINNIYIYIYIYNIKYVFSLYVNFICFVRLREKSKDTIIKQAEHPPFSDNINSSSDHIS